jgi:hypothetical protein
MEFSLPSKRFCHILLASPYPFSRAANPRVRQKRMMNYAGYEEAYENRTDLVP